MREIGRSGQTEPEPRLKQNPRQHGAPPITTMGSVDLVKDRQRYGRAERMLRALCRRIAAQEKFDLRAVGGFSAGPVELLALADEAEKVGCGFAEKAIDLDDRITRWLGAGWDEGPEPEPWKRKD